MESTVKGKRKDDSENVVDINKARRRIEDKFEDLTKELYEGVKGRSDQEAFLALQEIQDKAVKWAKIQLVILSSAAVLVLGVFGFFGYKTTVFNEKLDTEIKNIDTILKSFDSDKVTGQLAFLDAASKKMDNLNFMMNRFKRSQVKIILHYQEYDPRLRSNFIGDLSARFFDQNFNIDRNEVLPLETDKNQIIYFNPVIGPVANELAECIKYWFGFKNIEVTPNSEFGTNSVDEIIVKLRTGVKFVKPRILAKGEASKCS